MVPISLIMLRSLVRFQLAPLDVPPGRRPGRRSFGRPDSGLIPRSSRLTGVLAPLTFVVRRRRSAGRAGRPPCGLPRWSPGRRCRCVDDVGHECWSRVRRRVAHHVLMPPATVKPASTTSLGTADLRCLWNHVSEVSLHEAPLCDPAATPRRRRRRGGCPRASDP